jgi:hypothetical protein
LERTETADLPKWDAPLIQLKLFCQALAIQADKKSGKDFNGTGDRASIAGIGIGSQAIYTTIEQRGAFTQRQKYKSSLKKNTCQYKNTQRRTNR